jgi:hypothetical protein
VAHRRVEQAEGAPLAASAELLNNLVRWEPWFFQPRETRFFTTGQPESRAANTRLPEGVVLLPWFRAKL